MKPEDQDRIRREGGMEVFLGKRYATGPRIGRIVLGLILTGFAGSVANAADGSLAAEPERALFRINGEAVGEREFRVFLETIHPGEAGQREKYPGLANYFFNNRILSRRAEAEGVDKVPAVRSGMEGMTSALWRDAYWTDVVRPGLRIPDEELRKMVPPQGDSVTVRQLITEKREEAEELRQRALSGEDFEKIVRSRSIGLTRPSGGLSTIQRGVDTMYGGDLFESLFRRKPGDFTEVLEIPIGFAVIQVLEVKTGKEKEEEYFAQSVDRFRAARERDLWEEELARLAGTVEVRQDNQVLSAYADPELGGEEIGPLLGEVAVWLDGVPFTLGDLVDPSGRGIAHGLNSMELIVKRRAEDLAIRREVRRLGLEARHPDLVLKERVIRENHLAREYIDYLARDLRVTEEEIRQYYETRRESYVSPRAIDVSLIETRSEKRLQEIYDLLEKGTPFESVAEEWSDNRTIKGGRVGLVPENRIAPEFAEVKKLKVGEVSKPPIHLRAGDPPTDLYIVAKVNAVRESRPLPYDEVNKSDIRKALMARKREQRVLSLMEGLGKENRFEWIGDFGSLTENEGNETRGSEGGTGNEKER